MVPIRFCGEIATGIIVDLSGLEVIKLFSSSAQLSMKFQLLIDVEIVKDCWKIQVQN